MVKISTNLVKNCQKPNPLLKPSQMETAPVPRIMRILKIMSVQPMVLAPKQFFFSGKNRLLRLFRCGGEKLLFLNERHGR